MLVVIRESTVFKLFVVALVLAIAVSAGYVIYLRAESDSVEVVALPEPVVLPTEVAATPVFAPALTHDASELQRVVEEHAKLLTSLPPTAGPTPTALPVEDRVAAALEIANNPAGVPYPTPELENWFDPVKGLEFYRPEGGDWSRAGLRADHPYAELFYYEDYPQDIANFVDQSVYEALGRGLAIGAADVLPNLGSPSSAVIRAFARRVGWEIRHDALPVINVWSTFEFVEGEVISVYAVGGVMRMELASRTLRDASADGDAVVLEYLVPGSFMGPVVVQRVATRSR